MYFYIYLYLIFFFFFQIFYDKWNVLKKLLLCFIQSLSFIRHSWDKNRIVQIVLSE